MGLEARVSSSRRKKTETDTDGATLLSSYVFACRHGDCLKKRETKVEGASNSCGLRVFRCQLPAKNDFYAEHAERDDEDDEDGEGGEEGEGEDKERGQDRSAYPPLCALCGAPASAGACSRCHGPAYCCKEHQRRHWREGHREECTSAASAASAVSTASAAEKKKKEKEKKSKAPFVFPQFEVVISPEPGPAAREAAALAALGATRITTDVSKVRLGCSCACACLLDDHPPPLTLLTLFFLLSFFLSFFLSFSLSALHRIASHRLTTPARPTTTSTRSSSDEP